MRLENFPNVNDYRNPVIAEAMKILGYVNRYNRGIARVKKELNENANPDAIFTYDKIGVFGVTVFDALYDKGNDEKTRVKTRVKIIQLIKEDKNITSPKLAAKTGISLKGVEYHLSKLQSDGVLMRVGADNGGYWKILNVGKD